MPKLTGTTVVADRYGTPHLLREGDPLPEWAVGKVGPHLLDDAADPKPRRQRAAHAKE